VDFSLPEGMPWVKPVEKRMLAEKAKELGFEAGEADSVEDALAKAAEGDRIVVCGSLYLAADVYRYKQDI
jgi:folylpolyglutamate synthase